MCSLFPSFPSSYSTSGTLIKSTLSLFLEGVYLSVSLWLYHLCVHFWTKTPFLGHHSTMCFVSIRMKTLLGQTLALLLNAQSSEQCLSNIKMSSHSFILRPLKCLFLLLTKFTLKQTNKRQKESMYFSFWTLSVSSWNCLNHPDPDSRHYSAGSAWTRCSYSSSMYSSSFHSSFIPFSYRILPDFKFFWTWFASIIIQNFKSPILRHISFSCYPDLPFLPCLTPS